MAQFRQFKVFSQKENKLDFVYDDHLAAVYREVAYYLLGLVVTMVSWIDEAVLVLMAYKRFCSGALEFMMI